VARVIEAACPAAEASVTALKEAIHEIVVPQASLVSFVGSAIRTLGDGLRTAKQSCTVKDLPSSL
jgi:hypothetical protein